jgi:coenzyme F420-reducing hydrogenase beta subunit
MIDKKLKNKSECNGCHACFCVCPVKCITMEPDTEGFLYPAVNYDLCTQCSQCIEVCPTINIKRIKNEPQAYACINKDEIIREESSSGGMFTLFAQDVISKQGIVFGACFDPDFNVVHSSCNICEDLSRFRGSKYVQSDIGDSFKKAEEYLKGGRPVFFTGTPCQIEGLLSYLGQDYENLITADIICHGVPSPTVWKKYIEFRERISGSKTQSIKFRDKSISWRSFSMLFTFINKNFYKNKLSSDPYLKAFLKNICLRPSCHNCKFKSINRKSDITLADFWGIQKFMPEIDDNKGVSLIFANSTKGKEALNKISKNIIIKNVDINQTVRYNSAAVTSVYINKNRDIFFREISSDNFERVVNKYCRDKLSVRLKRILKKILTKLKITS